MINNFNRKNCKNVVFQKSLHLRFFMIIVILMVFAGCNKNDELLSKDKLAINEIEMPPIKNGRMYFPSKVQLQTFYNAIEDFINTNSSDSTFNTQEFLLECAEQAGYRCALSKYSDFYIGSERDNTQEKWLPDDIRLFMLNEFFEIQIAESIVIYQSLNNVFYVPDNPDIINQFRDATKGDDSIFPTDALLNDDVIVESKNIRLINKYSGGDANCYLNAYIYELVNPCMPFHRKFKLGIKQYYWPDSGSPQTVLHNVDVHFDFGDGSSQNVSNVTSQLFSFEHDYSQIGTYEPTAQISWLDPCTNEPEIFYVDWFNDPMYTASYSNIVNIFNGTCQDANRAEGYFKQQGEYKLHAEIWFIDDFFGGHQGAKSTSYHFKDPWIGQEGWYQESAYVLAEIYWEFKNSNCSNIILNGQTQGLETDWCNSCEWKRANKTSTSDSNFHIGDEEVHSYHKIENEGVIIEETIYLNTCD